MEVNDDLVTDNYGKAEKRIFVKKVLTTVIIAAIAAVAVLSLIFLKERGYVFVSIILAILACVPFFLAFEKRDNIRELICIAVMVALSVGARAAFVAVPFFKPVSALVIIAGIYFGAGAGFMTGALSAIMSNIYFGQGAWTPFQMLVWGLIGLVSGLLSSPLKKWWALVIAGIVSGAFFSLIMDLWAVMLMESTFNLRRYIATVIGSGYVMLIYMASNVLFLLIFNKPMGVLFKRLKTKYGVFAKK